MDGYNGSWLWCLADCVTCRWALMMCTMEMQPGCPMCWMGVPSHCQMGAWSRYLFSSSLFQCWSHGSWDTATVRGDGGCACIKRTCRGDDAHQVREGAVRRAQGLHARLVFPVLHQLHPLVQFCSCGADEGLGFHHRTWKRKTRGRGR